MGLEMSRLERLERWAAVLEGSPLRQLKPLRDVEFFAPASRANLAVANSPLALAYDDPLLRRAGLGSSRYGDGVAFFGLSTHQAHRILCSCGYPRAMLAAKVARRIRALAWRERLRAGWAPNPLPALARLLRPLLPRTAPGFG